MGLGDGFSSGNIIGTTVGVDGFIEIAEKRTEVHEVGGDGVVVSEIEER